MSGMTISVMSRIVSRGYLKQREASTGVRQAGLVPGAPDPRRRLAHAIFVFDSNHRRLGVHAAGSGACRSPPPASSAITEHSCPLPSRSRPIRIPGVERDLSHEGESMPVPSCPLDEKNGSNRWVCAADMPSPLSRTRRCMLPRRGCRREPGRPRDRRSEMTCIAPPADSVARIHHGFRTTCSGSWIDHHERVRGKPNVRLTSSRTRRRRTSRGVDARSTGTLDVCRSCCRRAPAFAGEAAPRSVTFQISSIALCCVFRRQPRRVDVAIVTVSRLLKLCAIRAASWPTASILCARRNASPDARTSSSVTRSCASLALSAAAVRFRPAINRLPVGETSTKAKTETGCHGWAPDVGNERNAPATVSTIASRPALPEPQCVAIDTAPKLRVRCWREERPRQPRQGNTRHRRHHREAVGAKVLGALGSPKDNIVLFGILATP